MDPPGQLEPRKVSHLLDFALGLGQLSLYSLCKLCWPPGTGPVHWDSSVTALGVGRLLGQTKPLLLLGCTLGLETVTGALPVPQNGRGTSWALPAQKKGHQSFACTLMPWHCHCSRPEASEAPSDCRGILLDPCQMRGAAFRKETPWVGERALVVEKLLYGVIIFLVNNCLERLAYLPFGMGASLPWLDRHQSAIRSLPL